MGVRNNMATTDKVKTELATQEVKPRTLEQLIRESTKELGRALPQHMTPERIVRIALTCIRTTPELAKCTPESFLGALFTSAQLGLEPIAGRAYLIPFNNKKKNPATGKWDTVKEVQFITGYKGLADLFYRHEKSVQLEWGQVHRNDTFDYEMGTNAYIKHKPAFTDRGDVVAYYVIATLSNGGKVFQVMSTEECLEHGKQHSKTWITSEWKNGQKVNCDPHWADSSPWKTSQDSMCLKTVLIQLSKLLPLSVELQRAISNDETSRNFRKGVDDILDIPDSTNWKKESVDTEVVELKEEKKPTGTQLSDGSFELSIVVEDKGQSQDDDGPFYFIKAKTGAVYICSEKLMKSAEKGTNLSIRYNRNEYGNIVVEKEI